MKTILILTLAALLAACAPEGPRGSDGAAGINGQNGQDGANGTSLVQLVASVDRRAGANIKVAGSATLPSGSYVSIPVSVPQATNETGALVNTQTQCARIESELFTACYVAGFNSKYSFSSASTLANHKCACDNGGVVMASNLQAGDLVEAETLELHMSSAPTGTFTTIKLMMSVYR